MTTADAPVSIRQRLLGERHALLDLSTRNRLLNTPLRTRNNRAIEIVDEKAAEVFRVLTAGRAMTFLAGAEAEASEGDVREAGPVDDGADEDDFAAMVQPPEDEETDERGVALRHADSRLQTRLGPEALQKRLFDVWYDAQTQEEEQGVNILYLALGLLRWYDADASDIVRHAPLVLLPVRLERTSAADRFKLRWREEPPSTNLTLQAKMKGEFGLAIDDFGDEDEVDLGAYCRAVAETVAPKARWAVLPDAMVLGFFSFSKFLMYRDLDPENWPVEGGIEAHPLVTALLRDGFPESEPLVADGAPIDHAIPPIEQHHIVDADSSQTVAIAEAAAGRTLVVKGPPGTGKSQTITNIIAAAVARGRKVLFVAEKMAALDVVHRRLRQAGLGPLTLELHSNKVAKRAVLDELRRTRDGQARAPRGDLGVIGKLAGTGRTLNAFAARLHTPLQPSGLSPHRILGRLASARRLDAPGDFALPGAAAWTAEETAERRALAADLSERLVTLGPVPSHPWRGVCRDALDPSETDRLAARVRRVAALVAEAPAPAQVACDLLAAPPPVTLDGLCRCRDFLALADIPDALDREALAHPAWAGGVESLERVVGAGEAHMRAAAKVAGVVNDVGRTATLDAVRVAVVTKGGSLFRFLDGNYRAQIALLRSYLTGPLPKGQSARLALVDDMLAAQAAATAFADAAGIGAAFGRAWRGEASDWPALATVAAWRRRHDALPPEVWARFAALADPAPLRVAHTALSATLDALTAEATALVDELKLDLGRAFAAGDLGAVPLDALRERLALWESDLEGVTRFVAFAARGRALAALGAGALVEAVHDGALEPADLVPAFDKAHAGVLRDVLFADWPELKAFDGDSQNNLVAEYRRLDRAHIDLARERIAAAHAEGRPRGAAGIGPLGVLNGELAKKRRHLPIRVLLDRAGPAIQQLKPVFMMSPLSVAQFLKPGGPTFDLLVMDEASQIEPVDALGAIARVGQMVVVGDERQLPPTAFFRKLTGDVDDESADDDGVTIQARDAESILELCLAKGVPHRMLSWHYRSKHQSLIAVSNREFYENRLFIVPSPYDAVAGMGLKFRLLENAPYDRGGTRTNPTEARIVAQAVIDHARADPDHSLGVATFSVAQRQAVLKELELLRRANPDVEDFFAPGTEPFFVKNLENIQGDERDVIFISVGYGKTEAGYLAHAFGPLSGEGGERRLNVLISRAKLRCEVFCNFTGADLDLERARGRGVAALKLFLTFAETGGFGLGEATGVDHDSEFERQVSERLRALGYDVKAQIGASGFRVDLAVSDPEKPGRFVLGIECDGAQYHSSRSARDRDRLRQQVLEAHGWIVHRIWSADWYLRPQEELKKVEASIAEARAEWRDRDEAGHRAPRAVPLSFEGERVDDVEIVTAIVGEPAAPAEADRVPYREADFAVDREREPHDVPVAAMAEHVVRIVEVEGPVHVDEIATRIRMLWGLSRAGARIRSAVARAAEHAAAAGRLAGDPFYDVPGRPIVARDRSAVASASARKPDMLPPSEIDAGLLAVIDENFGAGRADLVPAVARAFGFAATSGQLRAVLEARVDALVDAGILTAKGDLLVRGRPAEATETAPVETATAAD